MVPSSVFRPHQSLRLSSAASRHPTNLESSSFILFFLIVLSNSIVLIRAENSESSTSISRQWKTPPWVNNLKHPPRQLIIIFSLFLSAVVESRRGVDIQVQGNLPEKGKSLCQWRIYLLHQSIHSLRTHSRLFEFYVLFLKGESFHFYGGISRGIMGFYPLIK